VIRKLILAGLLILTPLLSTGAALALPSVDDEAAGADPKQSEFVKTVLETRRTAKTRYAELREKRREALVEYARDNRAERDCMPGWDLEGAADRMPEATPKKTVFQQSLFMIFAGLIAVASLLLRVLMPQLFSRRPPPPIQAGDGPMTVTLRPREERRIGRR
jgi:hypothetical protein